MAIPIVGQKYAAYIISKGVGKNDKTFLTACLHSNRIYFLSMRFSLQRFMYVRFKNTKCSEPESYIDVIFINGMKNVSIM